MSSPSSSAKHKQPKHKHSPRKEKSPPRGKKSPPLRMNSDNPSESGDFDLTDDALDFFNSVFEYDDGNNKSSMDEFFSLTDFSDSTTKPSQSPLLYSKERGSLCKLKFKTPFLPKYYKNQRQNIMCFPLCGKHGDYALAKFQGLEHDSKGATFTTCAFPVKLSVSLSRHVGEGVRWEDFRVLSFFCSAKIDDIETPSSPTSSSSSSSDGESDALSVSNSLHVGAKISNSTLGLLAARCFPGTVEPTDDNGSAEISTGARVWKTPELLLSKRRTSKRATRRDAFYVFKTVLLERFGAEQWIVVGHAESVRFQILSTKTLQREIAKANNGNSPPTTPKEERIMTPPSRRPEKTAKKLRVLAGGVDMTSSINTAILEMVLNNLTKLNEKFGTNIENVDHIWETMEPEERNGLYNNDVENFRACMMAERKRLVQVANELSELQDAVQQGSSDEGSPTSRNPRRISKAIQQHHSPARERVLQHGNTSSPPDGVGASISKEKPTNWKYPAEMGSGDDGDPNREAETPGYALLQGMQDNQKLVPVNGDQMMVVTKGTESNSRNEIGNTHQTMNDTLTIPGSDEPPAAQVATPSNEYDNVPQAAEHSQFSLFRAYVYWFPFFGGLLGAHHHYLGRKRVAWFYTCTGACFVIGWFIDFFRMPALVLAANRARNVSAKEYSQQVTIVDVFCAWVVLGWVGGHHILLGNWTMSWASFVSANSLVLGWAYDLTQLRSLQKEYKKRLNESPPKEKFPYWKKEENKEYSVYVAYRLWFPLGLVGMHRHYLGQHKVALQTTLAVGVGWITDGLSLPQIVANANLEKFTQDAKEAPMADIV